MGSTHDRRVSLTVLTIVAVFIAAGVASACLPIRGEAPALPRVTTTRPAESPALMKSVDATASAVTAEATQKAEQPKLPEVTRTTPARIGAQARPRKRVGTATPQREVVQPAVREQAVQVRQPAQQPRQPQPRGLRRVHPGTSRHKVEAAPRDEHPRREEKRCGYFLSKTRTASRRS